MMPRARRQVHRPAWGLLTLLLIGLLVVTPNDGPFPQTGEAQGHQPVVTSGDADAAYDVAVAAGLFGRFREDGNQLDGDLVDVTVGPLGLSDLHHRGRLLLDRFEVPFEGSTTELEGPVAHLTAEDARFEVHDNRYAWVRFDGAVDAAVLRFPPATELVVVPDGLVAMIGTSNLHVHYEGEGENNLTMEGPSARIAPQDGILNLTMTLQNAIHPRDLFPGSWSLVAAVGDSFVADILQPGRDGHRPVASDEGRLDLLFDPIDPEVAGDAAHRSDSVGIFPVPPHLFVEGPSGRVFRPTNLSQVFMGERDVAWTHISHDDNITQTTIRQPFGLEGIVSLIHDDMPPQIQQVSFTNTTGHWAPSERSPQMVVEVSEPVAGEVMFTAADEAHDLHQSGPAEKVTFGLHELRGSTRYTWTLTVTDRAGNDDRTNGTFVTPVDVAALVPTIEIHSPGPGTVHPPGRPVTVEAAVTDGIGRPLPPAQVAVFLDGENQTHLTEQNGSRLIARLGLLEDGPHTVTIRAEGYAPGEEAVAEVSFNVGSAERTPGSALAFVLITLASLVAVAARRR